MNGRSIVMNPGSAASTPELVNPESLGAPKGFNHGVLAPRRGRLLFVAGQAGWESDNPAKPPEFAAQFARALDKVLAVVNAAEGVPTDVVRMTCFVTDLAAYRASLKSLAEVWRSRFGKHYPAMALVEVRGLLDRGAMIEIEATAVVTGRA